MTRWRALLLTTAILTAPMHAHAGEQAQPRGAVKLATKFKAKVRAIFTRNRPLAAASEVTVVKPTEDTTPSAKTVQVNELTIKRVIDEAVKTADEVYKGSPKEQAELHQKAELKALDERVTATAPTLLHLLSDKTLRQAAEKYPRKARIFLTARNDGARVDFDADESSIIVRFFDVKGERSLEMARAFGNDVRYDEGYRYDSSTKIHFGTEKSQMQIRTLLREFPWLDAKMIEDRIATWAKELTPPSAP